MVRPGICRWNRVCLLSYPIPFYQQMCSNILPICRAQCMATRLLLCCCFTVVVTCHCWNSPSFGFVCWIIRTLVAGMMHQNKINVVFWLGSVFISQGISVWRGENTPDNIVALYVSRQMYWKTHHQQNRDRPAGIPDFNWFFKVQINCILFILFIQIGFCFSFKDVSNVIIPAKRGFTFSDYVILDQ